MTQDDFDVWYVGPIEHLNADPHGGFAVLMIAFPLIERYLREKSGTSEFDTLQAPFYVEFRKVFHDTDAMIPNVAESFWKRYRHGLLHQVTFTLKPSAGMGLKGTLITSRQHKSQMIIEYDESADQLTLLTKEFSERVVEVIRADFASFLGAGSPHSVFSAPAHVFKAEVTIDALKHVTIIRGSSSGTMPPASGSIPP